MEMRLKQIKLVAMDVDGTLTDGGIYIGSEGEIFKRFDAKDGMGLTLLRKSDIILAIITGRDSLIVKERAKELKIPEIWQNISKKDEVLQKLADKYGLSKEETLYVGDDFNDLPGFAAAGVSVCPLDASDYIQSRCDIVLTHKGGQGAIRELAEMILQSKKIYEKTIEEIYGSRR